MRGRYFFYNSNSSDYMQVIQTTCGSLQLKICGFFFSPSFFKARFLILLGFGQSPKKHDSWVSVRAATKLPSFSRLVAGPNGLPLWAAAARCSWRKTAMQREHQLQIPPRLGNPQLGKSVDFAFFEPWEQRRGARSALGMALVLRCPRISAHY